ncbi:MAG TPA: glycosyltransferase family 39 protein [Pseudonocardiaceae bacterium]|nr:glycosyltransferase family 39 protein [Pseudonocardiaceae bacterium]
MTRLNSVLAGHWLFALLLLGGIGMRVVAWLAYQPALIYTDSYGYLFNIQPLNPQYLDPIGYPLFVLRPLLPIGGLGLVSAVQHVAGIGMALLVYRVALRCGVRRWLAALATAPVLLDAYQLQIEQNILSDVWLEVLLAVLLWLLVGRVKPPGPRLAAAVGLVLGVAMMVRMVAIVLIVPVALYLLVTGRQWRVPGGWRRIAARLGALLGVFLAIVVGYAGYFDHKTGYWSLSTASGNSIYGRTAEVADCSKLNLDSVLAQLCPAEPLGQRKGVNYYAHTDGDPNWPGYVPPGETKYDLQRQFAKVVIEKQPLDVAKAILTDFGKGFLPAHLVLPGDPPNWLWQFQPYFVVYTIDPNDRKTNPYTQEDGVVRQFNDGTGISLNAGLARFLSDYQSHGYTPGTLLGVFALIGIAAGFGARKTGLAGAALFTTVIGLSLLGLAAIFEFSWRYQLPALVVFPLAAALGITAFIRRRGSAVSADPAD